MRTIRIRRMRADEARRTLEADLNAAFMAGELRVCVLHGIGTGALKRLTQEVVSELGFGRVVADRLTVTDGETLVDLHPPDGHVMRDLEPMG